VRGLGGERRAYSGRADALDRLMRLEYDQIQFPAYGLAYLFNDDASGICDEARQCIDEFLAEYPDVAHWAICPEMGEDWEPYFTWSPAFGLACDVVDLVGYVND
jgi:hypothetical protein